MSDQPKHSKPASGVSKKEPQMKHIKKKIVNSKPLEITRKQIPLMTKGVLYLVLLTVLTIAAISYVWYQGQKQQSTLLKSVEKIQQQNMEIKSTNNQLASTIETLQQNNNNETDLLRSKIIELGSLTLSLQSQLNLTQQQVKQKQGGINQEILLGEAEFLIRTAAVRLLLSQNAIQSISLLEAADLRLIKINDIRLHSVREALTNDIFQLKASKQADSTGAYLKLEAIFNLIEKQPINFILPKEEIDTKQQNHQQGWEDHLSTTTETVLSKWFQVTHYDEDVQPLVSQTQVASIRQLIQLLVRHTQWALIQNKPDLYQTLLGSLSIQLAKYFNNKDNQIIIALEQIKQLETDSMVAPLPKFLTVEQAMKIYIDADEGKLKEQGQKE